MASTDSHACSFHYSTAIKFSHVPYKLQFSAVNQTQEYIPDILELVPLQFIDENTTLEMRGYEWKWERAQTGVIPKYNIKFKTDLWILYYLEKQAAKGCCSAPRSLEYSIRLYSHGIEEFDPELLAEIFDRYKKISRNKFARERTVCDGGPRDLLVQGVIVISVGILVWAATGAFALFRKPLPPATGDSNDLAIEMSTIEVASE
jgi:hypothetical protein